MRMRWESLLLGLAVIASLPLVGQDSKTHSKSDVSKGNAKLSASSKANDNAGEQKFQQNCSRCHNAPQGFPPRISGTIVKHMRVRASLSEEDAREILRYLNPQ